MKNKNWRKFLKIGALLLAVFLLFELVLFINSLIGNPISRMIVKQNAENYIEAHYAGQGYEIETISYSFKIGGYYVHLSRPDSVDGDFTLGFSMTGKLENDDYDSRVSGHGNIASRLYASYRSRVSEVLESKVFPYKVSMGFGDLEFEREVGKKTNENALTRADLENDRFYDLNALGKANGTLVLYIDNEVVDESVVADILLATKALCDEAGISFYDVDLVLRYPPYDEISYERPKGSVRIDGFLAEDIYEEGILERVRLAVEERKASYAEENEK